MGISEMLLELGPVLVRGRLLAPLRAGVVELLGVRDELEGDADDSLVSHFVVACLDVGSPVHYLVRQLHKGWGARPRLNHLLCVGVHHFRIDHLVLIAKMGEEIECGDVGVLKLGLLDLRDVVVVDGAQKLVLERGVSVLVFVEDATLLFVASVGLCDYRASGADRMDRVDGGLGQNGERNVPVAHRLVLRVANGEDQMYKIPLSVVRIDGGGVYVELHCCGLDRFIRWLGFWHVHASDVEVRKQRLVCVKGGDGGDGDFQLVMEIYIF